MTGCHFDPTGAEQHDGAFRRALMFCLVINFTMFAVEIVAGLLAGSLSLLADSLDFISDSFSYAISLYVLARARRWRSYAALMNAGIMLLLGMWVLYQALHRIGDPALPVTSVMGGIGLLALIANLASAWLLYRYRGGDSNMRSVWLCSRNDAVNNLAIIAAAGIIALTGSYWPDIVVALGIALLEFISAVHIVRHAIGELKTP